MRRIIICVLLVTVLIAELMFSGAPSSGQTIAGNLLEQRVKLNIKQSTFMYALSKLSGDERIPIGFELALAHKNEYHLNIEADDATLQDVLDQIVQQELGYRWEMRDGVINIIPVKSRDEFVEKLLNIPVRQFTPPKVLGKFHIRDAIVDLPEVVALLKANGITASRYGYFYRYPSIYTNEKIDLSISQTDVRGVLNKVIKDSEHKLWMVSRSGKNLNSLDVGF